MMRTQLFELARQRILAVLRETGPRKRSVLDALVGERAVLDSLRRDRLVVRRGDKRGAVYAAA
jgi:hypothetical protein